MAIDSLKEIKMSNSSILAKQAEENQPVVLLGVDNEHKILVRGDFGGGNGYSATIPMLFPGKIPFAEIGFIKDGRFKFHPMPVDIVNLSENQVLESISCSLDSWL